VLKEIT